MKDERIAMPSQIRGPHPEIRELVNYKARLDVPSGQRQRALTILHAVVQEALRREWTVTPVLSEMRSNSWDRTKTRVWPGNDLFTIDAGDRPAAIRLRMKQRQVKHVPTKDENEQTERWGYRSYKSNDLIATDRMRLEIGAGSSGSLILEDTTATRIDDKLKRAIAKIQSITDEAIEQQERQRLRAIAEAEARDRAEILRRRTARYGEWVKTRQSLHTEVGQHRELRTTVKALRAALPRLKGSDRYAELQTHLEWAEQHLIESEPFGSIPLPEAKGRTCRTWGGGNGTTGSLGGGREECEDPAHPKTCPGTSRPETTTTLSLRLAMPR
ncbi:hypothetical protein GCM10027562_25070 [Arthrobacter pigmenti]